MNISRPSNLRRSSVLVAVLATLALMGSSCSDSDDGGAEGAASPGAAVAPQDGAATPDGAGSPTDPTGDAGGESAGTPVERPADFPEDLPLPDGANASLTGGAGYYSYTVDVSASAAARAIDAMIAAGYEALLREESGGTATARLNNGEYEVVASYQETSDATTLGLSIYPSR